MSYITTNNIEVFPSTKRVDAQRTSRLLVESNLVSLVNRLVDKDSFVITQEFATNKPVELNLNGYYFKIASGEDLTSLATNNETRIWASIVVTAPSAQEGLYAELYGQDDDNMYKGLTITCSNSDSEPTISDVPVGASVYHLLVLKMNGNTWEVPTDSLVIFDIARVRWNGIIDCGTI